MLLGDGDEVVEEVGGEGEALEPVRHLETKLLMAVVGARTVEALVVGTDGVEE